MRKHIAIVPLLLAVLLCSSDAWGQQPQVHVLALYSTDVEPDHLQFANDALKFYAEIAKKHNFVFDASSNWDSLNSENLKKYQLVIWLNNSPAKPEQRRAFEKYIEEGGAWLGFHAAGYNDKDTGWPWFVDFLGGAVFYNNSWPPMPAKMAVDDRNYPVTSGFPDTYIAPSNEWYMWKPSPRLNRYVQVLVTLDPSNYPLGLKGTLTAGDLPVAWTNKKYKMVYMNIGHGDKTFTSPTQSTLIENATIWLTSSPVAKAYPPPDGTEISSQGVVANPKTHKVYAVNTAGGTVTVIDAVKRSAATVKVGTAPEALDINPVTNKIYVANTGSANVSVIDGTTDKVTATVSVGNFPYVVAVNPTTNKVYVSKTFSNAMTVIDGKTNATTTLSAGIQADMIGVNATANKMYLVNYEGTDVIVLDGATDAPTRLLAGNHIWGVAVNSTTDRAYLPLTGNSTVSVVDGKQKSITSVKTGDFPSAIAVDPASNKVYAANYASDNLTIIDGSNNSVVATVAVGNHPQAIAVDSVNHTVFVASTLDNTVTVVDGKTNSVVGVVKAGNRPYAIAVDSATNTAFVAGLSEGNVVAIDAKTLTVTPVASGEF